MNPPTNVQALTGFDDDEKSCMHDSLDAVNIHVLHSREPPLFSLAPSQKGENKKDIMSLLNTFQNISMQARSGSVWPLSKKQGTEKKIGTKTLSPGFPRKMVSFTCSRVCDHAIRCRTCSGILLRVQLLNKGVDTSVYPCMLC